MMTHAEILLQMLEELKDKACGDMTYPEQMVYLNLLRELRHLCGDSDSYYHPVDTLKVTFVDKDNDNDE